MTDVQGYRAVMGVIGPSTNTVVQPDMDRMRPEGVTNHYRGIYVTDPDALTDEDFRALDEVGKQEWASQSRPD